MSEGFGWILGWWDRQERTWRRRAPRYRTWSKRDFSELVQQEDRIGTHLRPSEKVLEGGPNPHPDGRFLISSLIVLRVCM